MKDLNDETHQKMDTVALDVSDSNSYSYLDGWDTEGVKFIVLSRSSIDNYENREDALVSGYNNLQLFALKILYLCVMYDTSHKTLVFFQFSRPFLCKTSANKPTNISYHLAF